MYYRKFCMGDTDGIVIPNTDPKWRNGDLELLLLGNKNTLKYILVSRKSFLRRRMHKYRLRLRLRPRP